MDLIPKLKERSNYFLGTIRTDRLVNCQLRDEKSLRKDAGGSCDQSVETTRQMCTVRGFGKRSENLSSFHHGPKQTDYTRRWETSTVERNRSILSGFCCHILQ